MAIVISTCRDCHDSEPTPEDIAEVTDYVVAYELVRMQRKRDTGHRTRHYYSHRQSVSAALDANVPKRDQFHLNTREYSKRI